MQSPTIIVGLILLITLSFGLGFFFGTVHVQNEVTRAIEEGDRKAKIFYRELETERDRAKRVVKSKAEAWKDVQGLIYEQKK